MADKLTPQQLQAVTDRGGKLLVSAAAGSGKTKVLVERLMRYLTDAVNPVDIDSFLIITYTKAAAAELRGKIAASLMDAIAKEPSNRHLQKQMQRLYMAKISTVHGFCSEILREYAYITDIAADFRVAEETECQQLQMQIIEQMLENAYENMDSDPDFRAFVDSQGFGRDDRQVPEILLKTYNASKCHLNPQRWLDSCVDASCVENLNDASETVWGNYLLQTLKVQLQLHADALSVCAKLAFDADGMEKPAALLEDNAQQFRFIAQSQTWEEVISRKNVDLGTLRFSNKCTDDLLIAKIKAVRKAAKNALTKNLTAFTNDSAVILQDLEDVGQATRGLVCFVKRFDAIYDKAKRARHILDFSDLEHKTLDLLTGKARDTITAIADEISERFCEIMVDEYQDSNAVQDAIFSSLTSKRQNCFMVGDVKQSIYQFRLADPSIFIDKYNSYCNAECAKPMQGRKILLSNNFRSGDEVIQAVNDVFSTCMSSQVGGLDYTEDEMLREGISHTPIDAAVELYGIEVQEDTYAEEAAFTAKRISQLLDGKHFVREGEHLRPIRPSDIVILLRSPKSVAGQFRHSLEQQGIQCTSGANTDLLQTEEISVLHAFLQIVENPLQDIPLAAVLLSRVVGFHADDLAKMRALDKNASLYHVLCKWDRAEEFCKMFSALRKEARMLHTPQLIEKLIAVTKLDSIYSAMPDAEKRRANLQAFCKIASDFDAIRHADLGQFLEYIDAMQERGLTVAGEQKSDCVTIMSIHTSKGLEFPVVFLCGLSRGFNLEDLKKPVFCDRSLGLGLSCVDNANRIRYPSIAKRAIATKYMLDMISEEMRVLYVAMTRARDRLIMTYAQKNLSAELADIAYRSEIGSNLLLTGDIDSPGGWILQTAMHRAEADAFFDLADVQMQNLKFSQKPWKIEVITADVVSGAVAQEAEQKQTLSDDVVEKLKRDLAFEYSYTEAIAMPSKQTATQLKGRIKDSEAAENTRQNSTHKVFRKPKFIHSQASAKEYGTAMHTLMQYISFDSCTSEEAVDREVARIAERKLLTPEQAELIDRKQVFNFFQTQFGKKLICANEVLREFKFSLMTDASAFDAKLSDEKILLQGVVDCALIEPDGICIVDFKTDFVTEKTAEAEAEKYRYQVQTYAQALSRIYKKPIKSAQLYFFRLNQFVSIID